MAIMDAVFALDAGAPTTASLAATTSTADIVLGGDSVTLLSATGDIHIRVGYAGQIGASSASYTRIPANTLFWVYLNRGNDRIRLYNPGASSINYCLTPAFKS
jgi:hypothetical protein